MDKLLLLDKLLKKAILITDKDLEDYESTDFIDLNIEDFSGKKGVIFFNSEKDEFYKEHKKSWYRYSNLNEKKVEENKNFYCNKELILWCNSFSKLYEKEKNLLLKKINELEQANKQSTEELIKYVDLKILTLQWGDVKILKKPKKKK